MKQKTSTIFFLEIFKKIYFHLPVRRRRQFWLLCLGMLIVATLETVTAGAVAFFMATIANTENVLNSIYIIQFREIFSCDLLYSANGLILFISIFAVSSMACYVVVMTLIEVYLCLYAGYAATSLTEDLLAGFLNIPYEWTLSKNSADLIHSISWRPQAFYFIRGTLKVFNDTLVAVILLLALFYLSPLVSIPIALIVGFLSFFLYTKTRKYMDIISNKVKEFQIILNRHTHTAIHGIKDIKIYGRESLFNNNYQQQAKIEIRPFAFQHAIPQFSHLILQFIGLILISTAVCFMLIVLKASSAKAMGTIALLSVTAWRILPAVNRILHNLNSARVTIPHTCLILDYLNEVKSFKKKSFLGNKDTEIIFKNEIIFDHVSFSYKNSERMVLKDLSFKIVRGKTIGIVGVSGAGKSTLVDLILGLLSPLSGKISIDKKQFNGDTNNLLMGKVGYVPQAPYIRVGSIAENIAFGFTGNQIDRDRVATSCKMAAMNDFLCHLPKGIDTQIGERGIKLSGGQRQRVAIARALYHSPEMMIFDEATSSLDTKSEKAIQKTIYSLKGKLTLIIIAHRLSTIEGCDEIIWLENGRIRQVGPPEKILTYYKQSMKEDKKA